MARKKVTPPVSAVAIEPTHEALNLAQQPAVPLVVKSPADTTTVAVEIPAYTGRHYVVLASVTFLVGVGVVAGLVYAQYGSVQAMYTSARHEKVRTIIASTSHELANWPESGAGKEAVPEVLSPLYLQSPLVARAAVVLDATHDTVIYSAQGDTALPLASLSKLMTALVTLRVLRGSDVVTITPAAIATEGSDTLTVGEEWTIHDLVDYMLITSSNKAARALRDTVDAELAKRGAVSQGDFIAHMNATAKMLGMETTTFTSETGLDIEHDTVATNFGSAHDMARLVAYIAKNNPELLEATEGTRERIRSYSGREHIAVSTNKAISEIPGLVGGKTGYTDVAGGNLVVAFDVEPGHTIVAVVLGSGKDERFSDMLTLVASVRNQYGVTGERTAEMPL